jgi:hypothetical protein
MELPPGTLFTLQVTSVESPPAPVTVAVKTCPPPVGTLGDGGDTVTTMFDGGGGGEDDDDPPTAPAHAD